MGKTLGPGLILDQLNWKSLGRRVGPWASAFQKAPSSDNSNRQPRLRTMPLFSQVHLDLGVLLPRPLVRPVTNRCGKGNSLHATSPSHPSLGSSATEEIPENRAKGNSECQPPSLPKAVKLNQTSRLWQSAGQSPRPLCHLPAWKVPFLSAFWVKSHWMLDTCAPTVR